MGAAQATAQLTQAVQRRRRGNGLTPGELETRYPSLRSLAKPSGQGARDAWIAVFNARPDLMAALLGDFIKQVHAQPGRIGQRPMPREEQVDFDALVYGDHNDLPLTEVLPKLIQDSERAFVRRVGIMSRTQAQRMLAGQYDPDVQELRAIAAAVGKPASFFLEYRKAMALAAFLNLIEERPGLATRLYRNYLETRLGNQA